MGRNDERGFVATSKEDAFQEKVSSLAQAAQDLYGPTATGVQIDLAANGQHAYRIPLSDDIYPAVGVIQGPPLAQSPSKPNPPKP